MAFIRWIAGALLTLAAIVFAIANINLVEVVWSPLHQPLVMPLALACLLAFAGGFLAGSLFLWARGLSARMESRRQRKQINKLQHDLAESEERANQSITTGNTGGQALLS
jgi:uncharacterized integral membrane protein